MKELKPRKQKAVTAVKGFRQNIHIFLLALSSKRQVLEGSSDITLISNPVNTREKHWVTHCISTIMITTELMAFTSIYFKVSCSEL